MRIHQRHQGRAVRTGNGKQPFANKTGKKGSRIHNNHEQAKQRITRQNGTVPGWSAA